MMVGDNMKKKARNTHHIMTGTFIIVSIFALTSTGIFFFVMHELDRIANENILQLEIEKEKLRQVMRGELINKATFLVSAYYYEEAIALLKSKPDIYNEELKKEVEKIENIVSSLEPYTGRIEQVFFHSLIVYPELAFGPHSSQPQGYNYWMTTQLEFQRMLPLLMERGFVLVRISDLYEVDAQGNVFEKELYLPKGKRPLLMSVDNVGYPESRKKEGFASRLIIDENNEVTAVIRNPQGIEIISRTAEVFPIVDDFIKNHPEFSYRGAKGMIGITGSWGVMGYDPKIASEAEIAKKILNRLSLSGWDFVSHSYTHAGGKYFSENSTLEGVREDTELFKKWIVPIIGNSNVFIAPFGVTLNEEMYQYLVDEGYTFYLNIDRRSQPKIIGKSVLMPRINLDGFVMNRDKEYITKHFFDVDKVYDTRRPAFQ